MFTQRKIVIGVAVIAGVAVVVALARAAMLPQPRHTYGVEVQKRAER